MTDIYYSPYMGNKPEPRHEADILFIRPDSLLKDVARHRGSTTEFLRCPAMQDYTKNTFIVRSPIDLKFQVTGEGEDRSVRTFTHTQEWFDDHIKVRFDESPISRLLTLDIANVTFYSEEDFMIEQLPCMFHGHINFVKNTQVIPGVFNGHKWIRPLTASFEALTDEVVTIKRGDPLYYVKLTPKSKNKVNLIQKEASDTLLKAIDGCVGVKNHMFNNSMETNYKLAAPYLKRIKSKLFGKKWFTFF